MKKIFLVLAACALATTAALAQPMPPRDGRDDQRYDNDRHRSERPHHRAHKVWVPTHREHGRMVRGHYEWR
jgi:hypothetical protein